MTTPGTSATQEVRGTISVHARGFGFLNFERGDEAPASAFVPPPLLNRFLENDLVDARVTTAPDGRMTAADAVLVERRRQELFGTLVRRGGRPYLAVDRMVANTDWPFAAGAGPDAVLAEGTALVARAGVTDVELLRVVPAGADLALERCIVRHGVRSTFSDELLALASHQASQPRPGHRRDLRDLPTVTIDAASTRDIDDALSVLPPADDGALRVLVSIADVDAFVAEDSPLDREARARGTSVYLAGRVVPMFPEVLCDDRISLLEGKERPALTVELRIDPEGEVTAVDVYASLIRSHARLTYEAVARLLTTGSAGDVPSGVVPTLRWLRTAAARLSAVRAARGGIELVREEAYVTFAASGAPLEVAPRIDTEAHRLVERLMVAANECVARWLVERGVPGMFRVHDAPTEARTEQLKRFAHNFGIEAGFGPRLSPRGLLAFEVQLRDTENAPAIRTVMGKVLGPARYSATPDLHFGLGAPLYLHFTSPIRRYADLAVHRLVKRYIDGERHFEQDALALGALALDLNRTSLRAAKAETERHRMLVAMLFAGRVGERLSGNVVAVKPFGLVVQLSGTGVTGTIALESLPEGPYRVQLGTQAIEPVRPLPQASVRGGARRFSVGDPLDVEVTGAHPELGRIDLRWVG
jgi:ribonuclease R